MMQAGDPLPIINQLLSFWAASNHLTGGWGRVGCHACQLLCWQVIPMDEPSVVQTAVLITTITPPTPTPRPPAGGALPRGCPQGSGAAPGRLAGGPAHGQGAARRAACAAVHQQGDGGVLRAVRDEPQVTSQWTKKARREQHCEMETRGGARHRAEAWGDWGEGCHV